MADIIVIILIIPFGYLIYKGFQLENSNENLEEKEHLRDTITNISD
jgi:hypothetical protein